MRSVAVARPLCWLARYLKSCLFLNTGVYFGGKQRPLYSDRNRHWNEWRHKFICKTEKATKERTYLYLDRFKVLTKVRLNTRVLGLLRCADWQLPPFRSRRMPASFRVKQKALRSSETPVTFEPVDTVRSSENSPIQHYFCKNLKYRKELNLERWKRTVTGMPHEYSHTINTLWIATIAKKNVFNVVTM